MNQNENLTIWHHPKCSTSRKILEFLESKKCKIEVRLYLTDKPSEIEIIELLNKLGQKPEFIVRKKERLYIENYKDKKFSSKKWLGILAKHPNLIERPIVISKTKAWLARPVEEFMNSFQ